MRDNKKVVQVESGGSFPGPGAAPRATPPPGAITPLAAFSQDNGLMQGRAGSRSSPSSPQGTAKGPDLGSVGLAGLGGERDRPQGGRGPKRGNDSDSEESVRGMGRKPHQQGGAGDRMAAPASPLGAPQSLGPRSGPSTSPSPAPRFTPTPVPQQKPAPAAGRAAAGGAPERWEWPTWCLDFKNPSIEVFVVDEDSGEKRWCPAEPQSRVVDKTGRDAYLCAEYEWDGEYYAQDFGPQHVRRRNSDKTVFELFTQQQHGLGGDLDQTRIAPGRGRPDNGGGVSDYLRR